MPYGLYIYFDARQTRSIYIENSSYYSALGLISLVMYQIDITLCLWHVLLHAISKQALGQIYSLQYCTCFPFKYQFTVMFIINAFIQQISCYMYHIHLIVPVTVKCSFFWNIIRLLKNQLTYFMRTISIENGAHAINSSCRNAALDKVSTHIIQMVTYPFTHNS